MPTKKTVAKKAPVKRERRGSKTNIKQVETSIKVKTGELPDRRSQAEAGVEVKIKELEAKRRVIDYENTKSLMVKTGELPYRRSQQAEAEVKIKELEAKSDALVHEIKKSQSVRDTWLFSNPDGSANELGDGLLTAFAFVYRNKDLYPNPDFEDLFAYYYDAFESDLPERGRLVTTKLKDGTKKSVMKKFTRSDWRRRALTHLTKVMKHGEKREGRLLNARVQSILKVGRRTGTVSQVDKIKDLVGDIFEGDSKRQQQLFDKG
jgi:hypothetical protein